MLDEIKDYSKIAIVSVLKFAAVGIIIHWAYGLFKIGWYGELFDAGGWWIALALLLIILFFIGMPALYIWFGYHDAIGKAILETWKKNEARLTALLRKVALHIASQKETHQGGEMAASADEYKIVRFLVKRTGFIEEWDSLAKISSTNTPEENRQKIENILSKIIASFSEKIEEGFQSKLQRLVIINLIGLVIIEVISRIYP